AGQHSTNWLESDAVDLSGISGRLGGEEPTTDGEDDEPKVRRDVDVEVNGKRFSVSMWMPESATAPVSAGGAGAARPRPRRSSGGTAAAAGTGSIIAPMQGTIVKV